MLMQPCIQAVCHFCVSFASFFPPFNLSNSQNWGLLSKVWLALGPRKKLLLFYFCGSGTTCLKAGRAVLRAGPSTQSSARPGSCFQAPVRILGNR